MAKSLLLGPGIYGVMYECDHCGACEGRLFEDTFTGKQLCLACLGAAWAYITNGPEEEGDNLEEALKAHAPQYDDDDDDEED